MPTVITVSTGHCPRQSTVHQVCLAARHGCLLAITTSYPLLLQQLSNQSLVMAPLLVQVHWHTHHRQIVLGYTEFTPTVHLPIPPTTTLTLRTSQTTPTSCNLPTHVLHLHRPPSISVLAAHLLMASSLLTHSPFITLRTPLYFDSCCGIITVQ